MPTLRSLFFWPRPVRAAVLTPWLLALAACGSSPPVELYRLPSAPLGVTAAPPSAATSGVWLVSSVRLPDYLDRDALLWPSGATGLRALPGQRWAEPLRDAVPRVLRADLARLRGTDKVWASPLPGGLRAQQVLRVEVQAFEASADGKALLLSARWWLADPDGKTTALVRQFEQRVPLQDAAPDTLVAAHREALWALAQDIARTAEHP
ncbi:membrane integrity-associated transporter subunit PqiC [Ideonella sp. B508-1]|uniref:PqiC family protein n=1 Tax=Ideonella sp. B508-1 TaxID=137716 RepID=UPI0003496F75|nr:PqiC family protein [Ideonella sp. B508-1]